MGANHQKEIEFLCKIAKPDYGYITNFGKAHLEGFGGVEGVIQGKSEMYSFLKNNHKKAFVNNDDAIQVEKSKNIATITFSQMEPKAFVYIKSVTANPFVAIDYDDTSVKSHLIGLYNANNINAAITIGKYFNVANNDIKSAIENYIPENNRSQLIKKGTNQIILDAYNANPSSMSVALENFIQLDTTNKLLIIGDMFELGDASLAEHKSIVNVLLNENHIDCCFVGNDFYTNKVDKSNFHFFKTFEDFSDFLKERNVENSTILIKGSRGMALERTLEIL
jgi:UDP-N-acetylmuramoyl-tripeptide--D-alanyl-D-alanine ligase